jgi:hypothetical protein
MLLSTSMVHLLNLLFASTPRIQVASSLQVKTQSCLSASLSGIPHRPLGGGARGHAYIHSFLRSVSSRLTPDDTAMPAGQGEPG